MATFFGVIGLVVIPETYAPVLKAQALRRASTEVHIRRNPFDGFVTKYLSRPMFMLFYEPMVSLKFLLFTHVVLTTPARHHDIIHRSGVLNNVPHVLRISIFVLRRTWLATRYRISSLPKHACRYIDSLPRCCPLLNNVLPTSFKGSRRKSRPRRSLTTHNGRKYLPTNWLVLVRLDFVPNDILGSSSHINLLHWSWYHVGLHEWNRLYY